jgi:hypothetical protein
MRLPRYCRGSLTCLSPLPLRRKACWGFYVRKIRRLRSGLNPRTWVPEVSNRRPKPLQCIFFKVEIPSIRIGPFLCVDLSVPLNAKRYVVLCLWAANIFWYSCLQVACSSAVSMAQSIQEVTAPRDCTNIQVCILEATEVTVVCKARRPLLVCTNLPLDPITTTTLSDICAMTAYMVVEA